jgi:hypothetical protein
MDKQTTPESKPVRKNAAEVRRQRAAEEEAQRQVAEATFQTNRPTLWLGLWAAALRLALCAQENEEATRDNSWFFDDFKVNAMKQTFITESSFGKEVSEESLTLEQVAKYKGSLALGQSFIDDYVAEQERARREREEAAARKNDALSRVSDEDRRVLGLPAAYNP